jgi:hypothetical protein
VAEKYYSWKTKYIRTFRIVCKTGNQFDSTKDFLFKILIFKKDSLSIYSGDSLKYPAIVTVIGLTMSGFNTIFLEYSGDFFTELKRVRIGGFERTYQQEKYDLLLRQWEKNRISEETFNNEIILLQEKLPECRTFEGESTSF